MPIRPGAKPTGRLAAGALAVAVLGAAESLAAQSNLAFNAGVEFNFSNPGARSLGMGGAFIALADDATAAFANPAGLTTLSRPEVSVEGRSWAYTHQFTDRGRLIGTPTRIGVDTLAGLRDGEAKNTTNGLSFISFVYPGRLWTLALYRHELANFSASFATQGAFPAGSSRLLPTRNSLRLGVTNLGLAAGLRLADSLSLGAGISRASFALDSLTQRYFVATFGPPSYADALVAESQIQHGDASRLAFNLGLTWKATGSWQFGAAYRQGPSFDFSARTEHGPAGLPQFDIGNHRASVSVPSVFGVGASYQPTDVATVSLDYLRVQYSVTAQVTNIFAVAVDTSAFHVDDANQLHLGIEYNFSPPGGRLSARLGSWYDPDHKIRYDGPDPGFAALFRPGENQVHATAGLGWIGARFQIDGAFDYSRSVKTGSLSTVVRF
jgi:long-chain fatty acid transport protein